MDNRFAIVFVDNWERGLSQTLAPFRWLNRTLRTFASKSLILKVITCHDRRIEGDIPANSLRPCAHRRRCGKGKTRFATFSIRKLEKVKRGSLCGRIREERSPGGVRTRDPRFRFSCMGPLFATELPKLYWYCPWLILATRGPRMNATLARS